MKKKHMKRLLILVEIMNIQQVIYQIMTTLKNIIN